MTGDGELRVAIVGLGPKGLFALERLLDRAADRQLDVVAFEPHPVPGAGPVYDPTQPDHLRMNNAAEHVDLWWPGNATVPATERRSFLAWDEGRHGGRGAFVPRARVGRYLSEGLATVLRHAGPGTRVRVDPRRVDEVRPDGTRWAVVTDDGSHALFDEVLLATGHAWPERVAVGREVPAVFPVDRRLATDAVPAGAVVGVRGFALTAIDAALALTEGRGGRFVAGRSPHRLRYVAGGDGVRALVPFSRTGLPVLAKPRSDLHDHVPGLADLAQGGRDRIAAIAGGTTDAVERLHAVVGEVADAALEAVGAPRSGPDDAAPPGAREALERSLDVAVGARPPGREWAVGHAWRTLYPAVVDRFGGAALDDAGWRTFRTLAIRLERVAFGPSATNVAKLLALADAGVLDLDHVAGTLDPDGDAPTVRSAVGMREVDFVVDAVLAAPGVPPGSTGPVAGLLARGVVRLLPGRRGLEVDHEGTCVDPRGHRVAGLAAVGRPTEDAVIGHDTLSRTLHREPDRWARRVVGRATRVAVGPPSPPNPTRPRVEETA